VKVLKSPRHVESWVIYQTVSKNMAGGPHRVCEQSEWNEMEMLTPGRLCLIQACIASEAVATRLARGTCGGPVRESSGPVHRRPVAARSPAASQARC
jgi:hypothetical protein